MKCSLESGPEPESPHTRQLSEEWEKREDAGKRGPGDGGWVRGETPARRGNKSPTKTVRRQDPLSRPLVLLSRILGAQVATPGTLARPGWEGSGAVQRLHRARPKWATSGAAPRTGIPARALRRKRKRVGASGGDSEPPPPPGLATSRATRTPLGPALGPGPALPAAAAGAHAVSRTHHSGSGVLLTASKAAPPSVPLSDRTWGASRSHQAQPAQAASPLARRCPREGREGARAGWGHGASPCPPRAHAPAAPASLGVPLPREPSGQGTPRGSGAVTWEGGDCGFIST